MGPDVGESIPPIQALDQHGRIQTFDSIRGPEGAVVVFIRSADW
jgi:hypothetical protein